MTWCLWMAIGASGILALDRAIDGKTGMAVYYLVLCGISGALVVLLTFLA